MRPGCAGDRKASLAKNIRLLLSVRKQITKKYSRNRNSSLRIGQKIKKFSRHQFHIENTIPSSHKHSTDYINSRLASVYLKIQGFPKRQFTKEIFLLSTLIPVHIWTAALIWFIWNAEYIFPSKIFQDPRLCLAKAFKLSKVRLYPDLAKICT